jgi:hypothetical protein
MFAQLLRHVAYALALAAVVALVGCGDAKTGDGKKTNESKTKPSAKADEKHHPAHGPHDGHVFELTPEGFKHAHVEIVEDEKKVTAYLLDAEIKNEIQSAAAEATIEITTGGQKKSFTLKGEIKDGKASRYSSTDADLLKAIDAKDAKIAFRVELDGHRYNAEVEHVVH